eukprot:211627_1
MASYQGQFGGTDLEPCRCPQCRHQRERDYQGNDYRNTSCDLGPFVNGRPSFDNRPRARRGGRGNDRGSRPLPRCRGRGRYGRGRVRGRGQDVGRRPMFDDRPIRGCRARGRGRSMRRGRGRVRGHRRGRARSDRNEYWNRQPQEYRVDGRNGYRHENRDDRNGHRYEYSRVDRRDHARYFGGRANTSDHVLRRTQLPSLQRANLIKDLPIDSACTNVYEHSSSDASEASQSTNVEEAKHIEKYVDDVSCAADETLDNIENSVTHLNNEFNTIRNQIEQIQTLSSLSDLIHGVTSQMQKHVCECRNPNSIHKFKSSSNETMVKIANYQQWNGIDVSELNKKLEQHNIQQGEVRQELKECEEQIRVLEKRQIECKKRDEEITSDIGRINADKEKQEKCKSKSIDKIRVKITEVENAYHDLLQNTQHSETLSEVIKDKLVYFEAHHDVWSVQDVIVWIKMVDNGYFNSKDYASFFEQISGLNLNGSKLKELNSTLLKLTSLNGKDQRVLVSNIERITKQQKQSNICGFCTENMINTVMVPCGHQFACDECTKNHQIQKCPICRKQIRQTLKTFMAGLSI